MYSQFCKLTSPSSSLLLASRYFKFKENTNLEIQSRKLWLLSSANMRYGNLNKNLKFMFPMTYYSQRSSVSTLKFPDPSREGILEIKTFLKCSGFAFEDSISGSLIIVTLPKNILEPKSKASPNWDSDVKCGLTRIFVDKTTGFYSCPDLDLYGTWSRLRNFLSGWKSGIKSKSMSSSNYLRKSSWSSDGPIKREYDENSIPIESLTPLEFKMLCKMYKLKRITPSHFKNFRAKVTKDNSILFPVKIPKGDIVGFRKLNPDGTEIDIFNDDKSENRLLPFPHGLYNPKNGDKKHAIFVSSILDSIILGFESKYQIVTLSRHSKTLPPEHLPFFEDFLSITLWLSNPVGFSFVRKLGESRCSTMQQDSETPFQAYNKKQNLEELIKTKSIPCEHEYITTFEMLRDSVYLELIDFERIQGTKWARFDKLNDLLKGFRPGELTVFSGRTGSGKTTFMSEYSLDLCIQGVNTLWGSFEVSNVRLAKMQLQQFAAEKLSDSNKLREEFALWADSFQSLPMYYLTFHGSHDISLVLDAMLHSVYVYDIAHIIIDNVQFMMGSSAFKNGVDKLSRQDLIIEQFRKFATIHNVHITLVIHPRKENTDLLTTESVFGSAKATQEADNVIILQTDNSSGPKPKKFIQIVKNRFSGNLGEFLLFFNNQTLTFNKKSYAKAHRRSSADKKEEVKSKEPELIRPPGR